MIKFNELRPLAEWTEAPKLPGIYIIKNSVNGKEYVGKSSNLRERLQKHSRITSRCTAMQAAVKKYGREQFMYQVAVCLGSSSEQLSLIEIETISIRESQAPNGYNLTSGGEGSSGAKASAETRAKLSKVLKQVLSSPEVRAKMSASAKIRAGTPEARAKMSALATLQMSFPEARAKLSEAQKGRKPSAETRAKISLAGKGRVFSKEHRAGISEGLKGKVVSLETRAKMAAVREGKGLSLEARAKIAVATRLRMRSAKERANIASKMRGRIVSEETALKLSKPVQFTFQGATKTYPSLMKLAQQFGLRKSIVQGWLSGRSTFPAYQYIAEGGEIVRVSTETIQGQGQPSKNYFTYL